MASKLPKKFTRKWYLNGLMNSIFGKVKINFDDTSSPVIIEQRGGLADKADFTSLTAMKNKKENMVKLFKYCLLESSTIIKIDDPGFTIETAIDNADRYFQQFHISLNDYHFQKSTEKELAFIGISNYVLPAIFDSQNDQNEKTQDYSYENIKERFEDKLRQFSELLMKRSTFSKDYMRIDEQEWYYDPLYFNGNDYKPGQPVSKFLYNCNYSIPITIQALYDLPNLYSISIIIPITKEKHSAKKSMEATKDEIFQELVRGYSFIDPEHCSVSTSDRFNYGISQFPTQTSCNYLLSKIKLDFGIGKKEIYYLTRLDVSITESLYSNPRSHSELHSRILKRAKYHIEKQNPEYRNIPTKGCSIIMSYIEDILDKINQLFDYNEYILGETPNEPNKTNILSIFDIPYEELFQKDMTTEEELEQWNLLYISFDNAINSFLHFLHSDDMVVFLLDNASKNELSSHIERIESIIQSNAFKKAISNQVNQTRLFFREPDTSSGFKKARISQLYTDTKDSIVKYIIKLKRIL